MIALPIAEFAVAIATDDAGRIVVSPPRNMVTLQAPVVVFAAFDAYRFRCNEPFKPPLPPALMLVANPVGIPHTTIR